MLEEIARDGVDAVHRFARALDGADVVELSAEELAPPVSASPRSSARPSSSVPRARSGSHGCSATT